MRDISQAVVYQEFICYYNERMNISLRNKVVSIISGLAVVATLAFGGVALAASTNTAPQGGFHGGMMRAGVRGQMPGVFGTVESVNGTTLTVTSKAGPNGAAATTYTVDASNATATKAGASLSVSAIEVGDTVMVQGTVSGTNVTATTIRDGVMVMGMGQGGQRPGVFGTVASVSGDGTSFTVTSKAGPNGGTATTYTVTVGSAAVTKNGTASSGSSIAVGDTVMVQGTVSGTNVTATAIRDGVMAPKAPVIQGNGEPVVGGSVTAISGSTLTVTNTSNVTYTVDATNAKIEKGNAVSSLSSVAVNDNVVVQGTVNGNSVTATSVIDQGSASASSGASGGHQGMGGGMGGFFGAIGGFFHNLFGFF
jgi:hypothetical protein